MPIAPTLSPRLVAELVRQRLGVPDLSQNARITFLIPEALKAVARKVAADPNMRDLMMTDKADVVLSLDGNGSLPLEDVYSENIFREYMDYGNLYYDGSSFPMRKVSSAVQGLTQQFSADFAQYYIEGNYLFVVGATGGTVSFACPYYPAGLDSFDNFPKNGEIEKMLVDKIVEMMNLGSDTAEDGAN